jgi:hypothetical protein
MQGGYVAIPEISLMILNLLNYLLLKSGLLWT